MRALTKEQAEAAERVRQEALLEVKEAANHAKEEA